MKRYSLLILLSVCGIINAQLSPEKEKMIDQLFMEWSSQASPGGAIGIMQNGHLVYSKAFGLASLEYHVPNTAETLFNIASVSKQFTAMAIVRLQEQGKLSVDDDIRKYIPELPDFGTPITFRHMMHHTSGMRSLHMLLGIAGWRDDDTRTNEDLLRFMIKQKELNFPPGSEYMYCNTGYILMAIAVERITGNSFAEWMRKEIFKPLNMADTYVEDVYNSVVPGNATSYYGDVTAGFKRAVEYWGYTGSGNIHSTVKDILTWYHCFTAAPEGWQEAFTILTTTDNFTNGKPNNYAFGVIVDQYREHKRISHSGSIGGFRAYTATFPDDMTEIAVLTNFTGSNITGKTTALVNILLDLEPGPLVPPSAPTGKATVYSPTAKEIKSISGIYWSPEVETFYTLDWKEDHLTVYHPRHGENIADCTEKDIFIARNGPIEKIRIVRDKKGKITGIRVSNSRVRDLWMEKR